MYFDKIVLRCEKTHYVEQSLDLKLIASGFPKKEWFLLYIPFGRPLSVDILNAGRGIVARRFLRLSK